MTRPRFSRIVSELQQQYREQAAAGDWQECIRIAELIGASNGDADGGGALRLRVCPRTARRAGAAQLRTRPRS